MPEQSLANVDPAWAWSEYVPGSQRPWTKELAAHLFRRAGFSATTSQLAAAAAGSPGEILAKLFATPDGNTDFDRELDEMADLLLKTGKPEALSACWLYRMQRTPNPLLEKVTLFWHGHFATSAAKVTDGRTMLEQNRLLRQHALGQFGELAQAISRDAAMLIYLDSASNRKAHPNENYAREVMELFCLGLDEYTERDVQELARCFTGWEVLRNRFRFNAQQHDFGEKTILGRTGKFSGEEAVAIVLEQSACPRFIAGKLFRFFVCDEPDPSPELLEPLAREFRESGLNTGRLVQKILASNLFFSPLAVGAKIRSPVELGIGLTQGLEASTNVNQLAAALAELGQAVFFPPSVKGWDGGRNWINSSTVLGASNFVGRLVRDKNTRFAGGTLATLAEKHGKTSAEETVAWLLELLLAVPVEPAVRASLVRLADGPDRPRRLAETVHAVSLLPEFQLN